MLKKVACTEHLWKWRRERNKTEKGYTAWS